MKLGLLLPSFRADAQDALRVADEAAEGGLDGVFCYDHLWPMGTPTRPALAPFPLLATVACRAPALVVGPLVARVGLGGATRLREQFATLVALAPGRVVAALGTGDALSRAENEAYGLAYESAAIRRTTLGELASTLRDDAEIWIGAGGPATNELAASLGVTLNLWNATPARVAEVAVSSRVT
ncbi:MAG: LLM class flavin-dependent oxidoreductase, partial [Acidobacteriota bacterium]|nr:LLM class flavin-dependent oxidoreductase [Acidobacteriota bacterium]